MFETGQKIGPYILERPLGEGSYGVVWLAEERTGLIQRQIALKLPKDADPDIDAIRREAEVWLRAGKHHNVVQVAPWSGLVHDSVPPTTPLPSSTECCFDTL